MIGGGGDCWAMLRFFGRMEMGRKNVHEMRMVLWPTIQKQKGSCCLTCRVNDCSRNQSERAFCCSNRKLLRKFSQNYFKIEYRCETVRYMKLRVGELYCAKKRISQSYLLPEFEELWRKFRIQKWFCHQIRYGREMFLISLCAGQPRTRNRCLKNNIISHNTTTA